MLKMIFIVGPTGVGKSALGLELALKHDGEIVSADAMQVYSQVNIACDKPSKDMRAKVVHHCLDVTSVTAEYNVAQFRKAAVASIVDISTRGKLPIVVGGSGMYINILLDGIFESGIIDRSVRGKLLDRAEVEGAQVLHVELTKLDPDAAANIHPNDTKRIVRALEVIFVNNKPISQMQKDRQGLWGQHDIRIIGLDRPREVLYAMAEERVERMFANGLVEEVKALLQLPLSRTAKTLIGIPEVRGYLEGAYDLEYAKYLLKRNTRHYVKRQLTWFRRDKRIEWIEAGKGFDL